MENKGNRRIMRTTCDYSRSYCLVVTVFLVYSIATCHIELCNRRGNYSIYMGWDLCIPKGINTALVFLMRVQASSFCKRLMTKFGTLRLAHSSSKICKPFAIDQLSEDCRILKFTPHTHILL